METWKKNLYIVFFAEMVAITGIAFVTPFLPLYIKELGITNVEQAAHWSGWLVSAPALAVVIISPVWGSLADRYGRKPMIVRAFFGGAIAIFLMSMVVNVQQLLFLRLLQGALSGTIAACNSLIAASSPAKKMGSSLGLLQTGIFVGIFFGPLIGGVSADIFGFQNAFKITAALLFFSGTFILFFVQENFVPCPTKKIKIPFKKRIALISNYKPLLIIFTLLFLFQFSTKAIMPILPLFVDTLMPDPTKVSTITGLMFALTGLTAAISSVNLGKLFENRPNLIILIVSLIASGIFFFAQGLTTSIRQLAMLRLCLGFCYGGIIPIANTIISLITPSKNRGKIFGFANSVTFLGTILGPLIGGFVVGFFHNTSYVFFLTGIILLCAGTILPVVLRNIEMPILQQEKTPQEASHNESFSAHFK